MDKATFLAALQRNIGMLDDNEQKDIVDEYAQHIDMKVSQGMTEEEAIQDFGEFQDFVREVLDAYHVKAPFDQDGATAAGPLPQETEAATGNADEGTAAAFKNAFGKLAASATDAAGKAAGQLKATAQAHSGSTASQAAGAEPGQAGSTDAAASRWTRFFLKCKSVFWTLLRWTWNVFVVFCAMCALGMGLGCLFCLGFCVIVLFQGYPAIGASLMSLGATAALLAATFLLCKLVVRKGRTPHRAVQAPTPAGNGQCSAPQSPAPEGASLNDAPQTPGAQDGAPQSPTVAMTEKADGMGTSPLPPFPPTRFDTIPFEKVGGGQND